MKKVGDRRECEVLGCGLRDGCGGPVWTDTPDREDPTPRILVLGEAPGADEDRVGRPFVGKAGAELRQRLLPQVAGISDADVWISNVVKCRPPNNRTPNIQEISTCSLAYLDEEIEAITPRFIIACGATAIHWVLNKKVNVDQVHGIGYPVDGRAIAIPTYHPAAGLRDGKRMQQCVEDFHAIKVIIRSDGEAGVGAVWDQYAGEEDYREAETADAMFLDFAGTDTVAVDTETYGDGSPLYVQYSVRKGMGRLVRADRWDLVNTLGAKLAQPDVRTILHNAAFDLKVLFKLGIIPYKAVDTMVLAYLLQTQPQALKALAYRLCGMEMQEYAEVVGPYSEKTLRAWLFNMDVTPLDKKWRKRIDRLLGDVLKKGDGDVDIAARWAKIDKDAEGLLSDTYGDIPVPGLDVVPFHRALWYSCRDADATFRIYPFLNVLVSRYGVKAGEGEGT